MERYTSRGTNGDASFSKHHCFSLHHVDFMNIDLDPYTICIDSPPSTLFMNFQETLASPQSNMFL